MTQPRLKIGDTFVYTEGMRHGHISQMDHLLGTLMTVGSVKNEWYVVDGWTFSIKKVDACLPETKPRTLDDVKEGDVLVDSFGRKRLVLDRSGRIVTISYNDIEPDNDSWECFTIKKIKDSDWKFADQPEERWKPEYGEMYEYVDEIGDKNETSWRDDFVDRERRELGNCFKTKAEAEKAAEELKEFWRGRINNQK